MLNFFTGWSWHNSSDTTCIQYSSLCLCN